MLFNSLEFLLLFLPLTLVVALRLRGQPLLSWIAGTSVVFYAFAGHWWFIVPMLATTVIDYAIAGPAFETASKPGYGPEIGRKGLAEIARASRVPVLAIGGLNAVRAAEVLAVGPVGIAVNTEALGDVEARACLDMMASEHALPTVDPVRYGDWEVKGVATDF